MARSDILLWYCASEDCVHQCTIVTNIPDPIVVRGGHCLQFWSPKIRGKAVWKRGTSVEESLEKKR